MITQAVHYVGFRGYEYVSARRVFGPGFIHRCWDRRAQRDIHPGDTVIFAKGTDADPICQWNGADIIEVLPDGVES